MRVHTFTGGLSGYTPIVPEPDPITVTWAWSGNVSTTTATIKARCADASSVTLRYSNDPGLSGYSTVAGTEGADEVFSFALSGLSANTIYYYGFGGSDLTGRVRTFPSGASDFTVAAASCGNDESYDGPGNTTNSPAFDRITDRLPAVFIHMGDRGYADPNANSPALFRTNYNNNMANSRQLAMHLAIPVAYTWDDHDYGGDDSHGGDVAKPAGQQVYREHVPHWTLPSASMLYQTFVIGRVRFILLDARSERSSHGTTDNSSKTFLGATQKAWLKAELLAATEPCIVVDTVSPWIGTSNETWGIYSTERRELAEFFEDNGLTDRLILIGGDSHWLSGDDGTNSQYDTGSGNPGPIVAAFGPLDNTFVTSSGTWSEGIHKIRKQQYGTLDFVDDGSDITVTIRGWAVNGASETQAFDLVATF